MTYEEVIDLELDIFANIEVWILTYPNVDLQQLEKEQSDANYSIIVIVD